MDIHYKMLKTNFLNEYNSSYLMNKLNLTKNKSLKNIPFTYNKIKVEKMIKAKK